jgi:hypothetical protein
MKRAFVMAAVLVGHVIPVAAAQQFTASLSGSQMVPPVSSAAGGELKLSVSKDGESMDYALTVQNLKDATMAHLHLAPAGENGEPVVWLYPSPTERSPRTKEGVFTGTLAKGVIKPGNLLGRLAGKNIGDLVAKIKGGDICAIVHSTQNPAGEIRGQVH